MIAERTPVDPQRLTPAELARLLSAAAKVQVPLERIEADVAAGAPVNPDGTLHLVHYAAWLVKQMARNEDDHRGT